MHPDKVKQAYPKIEEWNQKWSKKLGREVTAGAFRSDAPAMKQPKILL